MKAISLKIAIVLFLLTNMSNFCFAQKADFSTNNQNGCAPLIVQFSNKSVNAVSYLWMFGNGNQSTQTNPGAIYNKPGKYNVTLVATSANGNTDTLVKNNYIEVFANPVASFTSNTTSGCAPLTVQFKDASTTGAGKVTSWLWDFGDGKTSSSQNPVHQYSLTGKYTVSLEITSDKGCKSFSSITNMVNVTQAIQIGFTNSNSVSCKVPLSVNFTNTTKSYNGNPMYLWDFGDGTTSTQVSPSHIYSKYGNYTVSLMAKDSGGCANSITINNLVQTGPDSLNVFTVSQKGCLPYSLLFSNKGRVKTGAKYLWDFGDGMKDSVPAPYHTYYKAGTYSVKLKIISNSGCTDSVYLKNYITVDAAPTALFTYTDSGACYSRTVLCKDKSVNAVAWEWNFGDGSTSNIQNPTHTYAGAGPFSLTLKVYNKAGCASTFRVLLKSCIAQPVFKLIDFKMGCIPFKVRLVDQTKYTGPVKSRMLDMGDGHVAAFIGDTFEYVYTSTPKIQKSGYTIVYTITDTTGAISTFKYKVNPLHPKPDFNTFLGHFCDKNIFIFNSIENDYTGVGPYKYLWKIEGDSTFYTSKSISKEFAKEGTYKVTLTLSDVMGCTESITKNIDIKFRKLEASFSCTPVKANCPPLMVTFKENSTVVNDKVTSWYWDFGDGSHSFDKSPQHFYYHPGLYNIRLIVWDTIGCSDTIDVNKMIEIKGPTGAYTIDKVRGCNPLKVTFTATSNNASSFMWDFGDGTIESGQQVTHEYHYRRGANKFFPALILSDSGGCIDIINIKDTITVDNTIHPEINIKGICENIPTRFFVTGIDTTISDNNIYYWTFNDSTTITGKNIQKTFSKEGIYTASILVHTPEGCESSKDTEFVIYSAQKAIFKADTATCVGNSISFQSFAATNGDVRIWYWSFGDGTSSTFANPVHTYNTPGKYNVTLIMTNKAGCSYMITKPAYITVGDTTPPHAPYFYRTTVIDDHSTRVDFGQYKSEGFLYYVIYRKVNSGALLIADTVSNQADTVWYDHNLNCLKNTYSYLVRIANMCGGYSNMKESIEHTTMQLSAKGSLNKINLSWTPYVGWKEISSYNIFRQSKYDKDRFDYLASVPADQNTFTDTNVSCTGLGIYKIIANEKGNEHQISSSDTAAGVATHVNRVLTVNLKSASVVDNSYVKVDWEKTHDEEVNQYLLEKSYDGIKYYPLAMLDSNHTSYNDSTVNVHSKSYYYKVRAQNTCFDLGEYSNIGKTIVLKVDTTENGLYPHLTWTKYHQWNSGIAYYEIQTQETDGRFTTLDFVMGGNDTTYTDKKSEQNGKHIYNYRVVAHKFKMYITSPEITSTSNDAEISFYPTVFVPNAFTPDDDNLNDSFGAKALFTATYHMTIYNRFGQQIFESNNVNDKWDGTYQGTKCPNGVYLYIIQVNGSNTEDKFLKGNVTLIR